MLSQNGYSADDRSVITSYQIGDSVKVSLRKGSPGELLAHFARWFDKNIRDLDAGALDDWGYAERNIIGSDEVSNHASGTAVDLNATKWALGSRATRYLTLGEIGAIHAQLALYQGCIRWGDDYQGRTDPMHFEINATEAVCDGVWAKLNAPAPPVRPPVMPWPFPKGHYVGDVKGPAASHGGFYASERAFVRNVQQWLVFRGAVPGVPPSSWSTTTWADGKFQAPFSTQAAARWHAKFYPGQPYPEQIWADDYARLTA